MNWSLSIFVERFGKFSYCRHDILNCSSLRNLDDFTTTFKDSDELKKYFDEEFKIFEDKYSSQLDTLRIEGNNKRRRGKIYANCCLDNVGLITIAIMYKGDEIVPPSVAYNNIYYCLERDDSFKRFFEEKRYLLKLIDINNSAVGADSSLIYLAQEYLKSGNTVIKYQVIKRFINAIKRMDEDRRYFYFRSLVNLCDLRKAIIHSPNGSKVRYLDGQTIMPEVVLYGNGFAGIDDDKIESSDGGKKYEKDNGWK